LAFYIGGGALAKGMTYFGVSRCTHGDGLWLHRPVKPSDILFDDRILEFLRRASR
jgi:ATP-dependent DNA helicase PIF1